MAYKFTQPNLTGAGIDEALIDVSQSVPSFVPMMLLFIFGVVFLSGFLQSKRRTGRGDAALWATMAGITTSIVAVLMSMRDGMINILTLTTVVIVTLIAGVWLITSKDRI